MVDEIALQQLWDGTVIEVAQEDRTRQAFEGERPPEVWVGGSPIRLHLDMLQGVVPIDEWDKNLVRISCVEEYKVAATIVLWHTVAVGLREEAVRAGWFELPLERWVEVLKPGLDWTLRAAIFGRYIGPEVYKIRACMNVTARSETDADWVQEVRNRRSWSVPKLNPLSDTPKKTYVDSLETSLLKTARKHIAATRNGMREVETLASWWQARHHHTPSGSSSQRVLARDLLKEDSRLRAQDRPNKKAVVECLDEDWIQGAFCEMPHSSARCSTKNEPGDKNRALHANDDVSYFVEAYNSVHMEKVMAFDGMYGKQSPADVMEWMKVHEQSIGAPNKWWCSTDYKDFNTEHHKAELTLCNLARAKAWNEAGEFEAREDKVYGCMWMAIAHSNSFLRITADNDPKVINGLYTGSRNTLMDHNYMHCGYVDCALDMIRMAGWDIYLEFLAMVGDDEDTLTKHWYDAMLYTSALPCMGHHAQPVKQEGGRTWRIKKMPKGANVATHTFLQRKIAGDVVPVRPLAKVLATLAGGNWYVDPGVWYDSAIPSASDNWWECVTRGMDKLVAQRLCAATLDRLMIIKPEKGSEHEESKWLEWWDYRDPENRHPLWRGSIGNAVPRIEITTKPEPHKSWPSKATDAWMLRVKPVLDMLRDGRVEMYKDYLLRESIGPSFHHERQKQMREQTKLLWPERKEREYGFGSLPPPAQPGLSKLLAACGASSVGRRPVDEDEQAALVGVDVYLVKLCGGAYKIMDALRPDQWGKYMALGERYTTAYEWANLDSSIRAWMSSLGAFNPNIHEGIPKKRHEVHFIWMPNAAGKSWLSMHFPLLLDSDVAIYQAYGWGRRYERYNAGTGGHVKELQVAWNTARDSEKKAVLTQWRPQDIWDACQQLGIKPVIKSYDPGENVRRVRLLDRGWQDEKVEEYLRYAREYASWLKDHGAGSYDNWKTLVEDYGYAV
jgi:hypothetical protein